MNTDPETLRFPYKFFLTLKGSPSPPYIYEIELTEQEESNPKPRLEQERQNIKTYLERETERKVRNSDLDTIIKKWTSAIEKGFFDLKLTLDLPLLIQEDFEHWQENGYQELPELVPPDIMEIEPTLTILPPLDF